MVVLTSTFPRWKGDKEPPFVFELSKRLAREYEVIVLAPHAPGAKHREELEGLTVCRFAYFFSQWEKLAYNGGILANLKRNRWNYLLVPFFCLFELICLIRLLRTMHIDAIHAHWLIPQGLIALAARIFARTPPVVICTSHGGDLFGLSGKLFTYIKRFILRKVDKFTVVSQAMRDYAQKLVERQDIAVIPMGVDLARDFTPSHDATRAAHDILFVGRLVEKKGVGYLILAMQEVLKFHPHATLLIAGDGPDKNALQQLACELGIESQIHFLGPVANTLLQEKYRRATIFAAPSVIARGGDQEGLGLVFVEALGCACPVIASDLPAIQDVIIDGVTGLTCRQKDSGDLADKIVSLLDNPDLRISLGQNGRKYVENKFDWEFVAQQYADLIREALR